MSALDLHLELFPAQGALVWELPMLGLVVACPHVQKDSQMHWAVSIVLDGVIDPDVVKRVAALVRINILPKLPGRFSLLLRNAGVVLPLDDDGAIHR